MVEEGGWTADSVAAFALVVVLVPAVVAAVEVLRPVAQAKDTRPLSIKLNLTPQMCWTYCWDSIILRRESIVWNHLLVRLGLSIDRLYGLGRLDGLDRLDGLASGWIGVLVWWCELTAVDRKVLRRHWRPSRLLRACRPGDVNIVGPCVKALGIVAALLRFSFVVGVDSVFAGNRACPGHAIFTFCSTLLDDCITRGFEMHEPITDASAFSLKILCLTRLYSSSRSSRVSLQNILLAFFGL